MTAASFFRDITAFSIQIALVALTIAVLVRLVRVPARVRYLGLRLALAATLLVPWLLRAPEIQARTSAAVGTRSVPFPALPPTGTESSAPVSEAVSVAPHEPPPPIPWTRIVLGTLFTGVVARAMWLAVGVLRLLRLKRLGVTVDVPEYAELQQQLGTCATIAHVAGLSQPATFGIRRPIVLLPEAIASAPASLRRAVVTHELFHVQRRDWLCVLAEEAVRTALWFHPAVLWLTSHIQLAREEIVDELTVRATGDRRTYVEALLAFADTPGLSPAPAFAHRRQLFHRILSVSKEKVMSRPRMLSSATVLLTAVVGASWYASTLFPILKAAKVDVQAPAPAVEAQALTERGPRMVLDGDVELRTEETTVRAPSAVVLLDRQTGAVIALRPITPENPIPRRTRGVAPMSPPQFRDVSAVVSAQVTLDGSGTVTSVAPDACSVSNGRSSAAVCAAFSDAVAAAIRQWRYDRPAQGPMQFYVKVTFRPGTEPTIMQSGESWLSAVHDTQDSLRVLAEQTRRGDDRVATDDFLRARLAEMSAQFRELERAQRLALERGPANPDFVRLQQELARMNDEMARVEQQLRDGRSQLNANEQTRNAEQLRETMERLRESERQLEESERRFEAARAMLVTQAVEEEQARAAAERLREAQRQLERSQAERTGRQPEQTTTAAVSREPAPPADSSRQLVSPSGRAPIRTLGTNGAPVPGLQLPIPTKSVKPAYPLEAMESRLQGTVAVEVLVDERGRVADARVIRGVSQLHQAALDAAKQFEFRAARLNGEPVPVLVMLEMHFTLK